ncbi:MAG: replication-associated recombination protein A [Epsilonproteobacteria bacterium]|nr:replication-associated recombination protein A [Campylobacterota bacterium]
MNLASIYRPTSFEDILSQDHLVGKDGIFRKFLQKSYFPHTLLFGPPGSGKTTIARVVAKELKRDFFEFNATSIKIDEVRKTIKKYENSLIKPVIFIDEIHRLSKNQQEVLLPFLENNSCLLLGASTQNPYYSITHAFRSRVHIFELNPIKKEDLKSLLLKIAKKEKISLDEEAIKYLINSSGGDVRAMINLLESASYIDKKISTKILQTIRPKEMIAGSSEDEEHYNLISALIKSIRGSDIDAALFYLARLIEAAEPPEFIARRLAILASEDIGNANPNALNLASSTLAIVKEIGYPEARITLSQLVIYLASSPKSNAAYKAINKAINLAKKEPLKVPKHLINHSKEYLYPHDFGGYVKQEYLLKKLNIYQSSGIGFEKTLESWIEKIKGYQNG